MALVLVVDDELSFRFFLKALFETEGHEVLVARNAEEGLGHLRARKPDLMTLDVMMPGRGGLEMYRAIQADKNWRGIPVIMLSGVGAATYSHALAMIGVSGNLLPEPFAYIEKPPRPEELISLARAALGGRNLPETGA
jgi:CheY-like chemotaxis protein